MPQSTLTYEDWQTKRGIIAAWAPDGTTADAVDALTVSLYGDQPEQPAPTLSLGPLRATVAGQAIVVTAAAPIRPNQPIVLNQANAITFRDFIDAALSYLA